MIGLGQGANACLIALGLLLATFGSPVSADEPVFRPASPADFEKATVQARSLFRSASIAFVVACDRRPTYAGANSAGVTLGIERGQGPGCVVRLSATGEVQWQHDVSRSFDSPYPPEFTPGANGSVMCAYMVLHEDGPIRYLVLAPDGAVAYDDTVTYPEVDPSWGRWLSPEGDYYYDVDQVGSEILLRRLTPGNRRIRIPPLESSQASNDEELTIGFIGKDRLFVSGMSTGKRRASLVDLRSHVALWTELEFPATARPTCVGRFQADVGRGGELIYVGQADSARPDYRVYGFDVDGDMLWGKKMSGDWIWDYPKWVVCSTDQDVASLIAERGLGIIDTRTGRLLDVHEIADEWVMGLWWTWEASFTDGRLTLIGQVGGGSNQPILIQATVGSDGKITSLEEPKIMMRGLAPSALSCIVMPGEGDAWIVAGFRK